MDKLVFLTHLITSENLNWLKPVAWWQNLPFFIMTLDEFIDAWLEIILFIGYLFQDFVDI